MEKPTTKQKGGATHKMTLEMMTNLLQNFGFPIVVAMFMLYINNANIKAYREESQTREVRLEDRLEETSKLNISLKESNLKVLEESDRLLKVTEELSRTNKELVKTNKDFASHLNKDILDVKKDVEFIKSYINK